MALRTVPIHQSFTRPSLLLGCDRELIISSGVVAFALVISAQQWVAFWTGLTLWVFSLFVLRQLSIRKALYAHELTLHYFTWGSI